MKFWVTSTYNVRIARNTHTLCSNNDQRIHIRHRIGQSLSETWLPTLPLLLLNHLQREASISNKYDGTNPEL